MYSLCSHYWANAVYLSSGFTAGRSIIDAILALRLLAGQHRATDHFMWLIYWYQIWIRVGRQKSTMEGTARFWYFTVSSSPHSGSPYWHHGTGSHTIWPVRHISHNFRSIRLGYILAPALFCCTLDWLVRHCNCRFGTDVGSAHLTDTDYTDDAVLFTADPNNSANALHNIR